jgi:hypothetical protein
MIQIPSTVSRKGRKGAGIRLILALTLGTTWIVFPAAMPADTPPPGLPKRVAERETHNEAARQNYMYRQTVIIEELDTRGVIRGRYREVREVIFTPAGERVERLAGKPSNSLKNLRLTEEDFRDVREVQPFLFTNDLLWRYQARYRGEDTFAGELCYLLEVKPKQILEGQRLFSGIFWVSQKDHSIVRSEGKAVPEIRTTKEENLFPLFTTVRQKVDGENWFPILTVADDTLQFVQGPLRLRMRIEYSGYRRFGAESTVTFEEPGEGQP